MVQTALRLTTALLCQAKGSGQVPTGHHAVGLSDVNLDFEYNYEGDHNLNFSKLVQIQQQIEEYKSKTGRVDFSDMIAKYIDIAEPPNLDLLIVDEAQDLTPLQWRW